MVARGRPARRRGYGYERDCARWLTEVTGTPVATTRRVLRGVGPDLAQQVGGQWVPAVQGFSVECKAVDGWAPEQWLAQADRQAEGVAGSVGGVVMVKRPNRPVAESWVLVRLRHIVDYHVPGWVAMYASTFWREIA